MESDVSVITYQGVEQRGFKVGRMYSVEYARGLANKLNQACDDVEKERSTAKEVFLDLVRKLGFIK